MGKLSRTDFIRIGALGGLIGSIKPVKLSAGRSLPYPSPVTGHSLRRNSNVALTYLNTISKTALGGSGPNIITLPAAGVGIVNRIHSVSVSSYGTGSPPTRSNPLKIKFFDGNIQVSGVCSSQFQSQEDNIALIPYFLVGSNNTPFTIEVDDPGIGNATIVNVMYDSGPFSDLDVIGWFKESGMVSDSITTPFAPAGYRWMVTDNRFSFYGASNLPSSQEPFIYTISGLKDGDISGTQNWYTNSVTPLGALYTAGSPVSDLEGQITMSIEQPEGLNTMMSLYVKLISG